MKRSRATQLRRDSRLSLSRKRNQRYRKVDGFDLAFDDEKRRYINEVEKKHELYIPRVDVTAMTDGEHEIWNQGGDEGYTKYLIENYPKTQIILKKLSLIHI